MITKNTLLCIISLTIILICLYNKPEQEQQKINKKYYTLLHLCDDGYNYYYKVKKPHNFNINNINNFNYQFVHLWNNKNYIPKKHITTNKIFYISNNDPEYKFIYEIRYNYYKYKEKNSMNVNGIELLFSEFVPKEYKKYDILVQTSH